MHPSSGVLIDPNVCLKLNGPQHMLARIFVTPQYLPAGCHILWVIGIVAALPEGSPPLPGLLALLDLLPLLCLKFGLVIVYSGLHLASSAPATACCSQLCLADSWEALLLLNTRKFFPKSLSARACTLRKGRAEKTRIPATSCTASGV